ncbi:hypothetical protein HMPREF0021_00959 [Acinetobacter baumannii 6013150]|nr:hypothetical protein HMPREF0021_00959 [Acinetobacter baumannii 6013150]EGJ64373.1 hypothetical protein HMPREF0020_02007 [Acinetobacter baumannii 6013113]
MSIFSFEKVYFFFNENNCFYQYVLNMHKPNKKPSQKNDGFL